MPEHLELQQLVGGVLQSGVRHRSLSWLQCSCPYLGIILATVSSFFFSLCSVIVKGLVDINPIELATFRFIGVLLPSIPIAIYKQERIFPRAGVLHID
ncbi:solute carrier family 35 member G1 isoform X2 [Armigeres subalbatus]|uniref:solute carrier family 35 member G1 isoform X2 n=1 Tax=Armigeres subalbatus TaxID=124917 RepID=UPI002ED0C36E